MSEPEIDKKRMRSLLEPYYPEPGDNLLEQMSVYLALLRKWNARMNLTAIRDAEQIITRHFGESLFAARHVPPSSTVLDFGSGAGFPGIPIALVRPEIKVTLAESQGKKASFLMEVVRTLELAVEIWPRRVEALPADRLFDVVVLRAVDHPQPSFAEARLRLVPGGAVVHLGMAGQGQGGLISSLPLPAPSGGALGIYIFRD